MPKSAHRDRLAEKRYVTVLLRLLIDRRGRLVHGELADLKLHTQARFAGWREMVRALRDWLLRLADNDHSDHPQDPS